MKRNHFWRRLIIINLAFLLAFVFIINAWVTGSTEKQIYTTVNDIPHSKVGLLLGTSKFGKNGRENLYYKNRISAAVLLFRAGKIDYILVSGDNRKEHYNEPEMMMKDLIAAGIPADRIVPDFAGFRTLDSILRCKEVFGEDYITIISQEFHNQRALFIANHKEVHAIAYNATDVGIKTGFLVQAREKLARVKMAVDLMINRGPKFYGPRIKIG